MAAVTTPVVSWDRATLFIGVVRPGIDTGGTQEAVGAEILLATFDQQLWEAAPKAGLKAWPNTLPA